VVGKEGKGGVCSLAMARCFGDAPRKIKGLIVGWDVVLLS